MSKEPPLKGIIGYLITPFAKDGKVDIAMLKTLTRRMLEAGVHGVAPLGSTGVLPYLTDAEREAVTEAVTTECKGKVPTLVGVSAMTTERVVHHAKFAEKAGATALMIIPMSYWKLTEDEIFTHFDTVAKAVGIPIMAYNNPGTGGLDMSPEFLVRLMTISNVTMVKESAFDVTRYHKIRALAGPEAWFYNGTNSLALGAFAAGAQGWCTSAAHIIPEKTLALYDAAVVKPDLKKAAAIFDDQFPFLEFLVKMGIPRVIAAALADMGTDVGPLRAPLLALAEKDRATLKRLLREVGAIS